MEKECAGMAKALKRLSPKLHIAITPKGYEDDLLTLLCETEEQREQLSKFWQNDLTFSKCSTCDSVLKGIIIIIIIASNAGILILVVVLQKNLYSKQIGK
jgi:hypothetical protein